MFSTFDCAVKGYRQKEDAWNAIISGFMTGGCLAARSECPILVTFLKNLTCLLPLGGPKAAFGSAVACGILLGVFEGVGVLLGRVFSEGQRPQLPPCEYSLWLVLCTTTHLSAALSQYKSLCPPRRHHLLPSDSRPYTIPSYTCIVLHFTLIPATGTFAHIALLFRLPVQFILLTQYIITFCVKMDRIF